jgi:hypothetical protein
VFVNYYCYYIHFFKIKKRIKRNLKRTWNSKQMLREGIQTSNSSAIPVVGLGMFASVLAFTFTCGDNQKGIILFLIIFIIGYLRF